ncbi:MAG: hypothetical protein PHZ09_05770 [Eubacteriales bacterium]|nr:hypothetical protein [Eubacteriales bacterium]
MNEMSNGKLRIASIRLSNALTGYMTGSVIAFTNRIKVLSSSGMTQDSIARININSWRATTI